MEKVKIVTGDNDATFEAAKQELSASIDEAVSVSARTRFCVNSRFSSIHTDACKRGFMTMLERTLGRHAELPSSERARIERVDTDKVNELEGQLLAPESVAPTWGS